MKGAEIIPSRNSQRLTRFGEPTVKMVLIRRISFPFQHKHDVPIRTLKICICSVEGSIVGRWTTS